MSQNSMTIAEVLRRQNEFKWSDALYADQDHLADPCSPCLVLDPDSVACDEDEEPVEARKRGFSYILSIQDIQGVHGNLEAQVATFDAEQLLAAFLHYFEKDAFIVINKSGD